MAGAAAAHQPAAASRKGNGQQIAGQTRRSSGYPQRAQQGATAAAAAAPAALDSLSRLQQLADASPQVAQLRRLQALADSRFAPVSQLSGGPEEEELIQGKFASAELQPQHKQLPRANNTGLPDQLKSGIESLSGMSLDHVRVHYNSSQPAQLNALAYAQGSEIHVAPGQEQHLPHEAWHVVQQAQGRVKPTLQIKDGLAVNDDRGLEHEADVMGRGALSDGVTSLASVQRKCSACEEESKAQAESVVSRNREYSTHQLRGALSNVAQLASCYFFKDSDSEGKRVYATSKHNFSDYKTYNCSGERDPEHSCVLNDGKGSGRTSPSTMRGVWLRVSECSPRAGQSWYQS